MIICRCLKVRETFVCVPPMMLTVFAKHGVKMSLKDGVKPVNKNQII